MLYVCLYVCVCVCFINVFNFILFCHCAHFPEKCHSSLIHLFCAIDLQCIDWLCRSCRRECEYPLAGTFPPPSLSQQEMFVKGPFLITSFFYFLHGSRRMANHRPWRLSVWSSAPRCCSQALARNEARVLLSILTIAVILWTQIPHDYDPLALRFKPCGCKWGIY